MYLQIIVLCIKSCVHRKIFYSTRYVVKFCTLVTKVKCYHFGEVWIKVRMLYGAAFHPGHKGAVLRHSAKENLLFSHKMIMLKIIPTGVVVSTDVSFT